MEEITKKEKLYFLKDALEILQSARVDAIRVCALAGEACKQIRDSEVNPYVVKENSYRHYNIHMKLSSIKSDLDCIGDIIRFLGYEIDKIENTEEIKSIERCEATQGCGGLVVTGESDPFALCEFHKKTG